MSNYYYLADVENKRVISLGKATEAKWYLPYLASIYKKKPVCVYGDESHAYVEDKYVFELCYKEDAQNFGIFTHCDSTRLADIEMSKDEFYKIMEQIGGKEVSNLDDYIPSKYTDLQKDNDVKKNTKPCALERED